MLRPGRTPTARASSIAGIAVSSPIWASEVGARAMVVPLSAIAFHAASVRPVAWMRVRSAPRRPSFSHPYGLGGGGAEDGVDAHTDAQVLGCAGEFGAVGEGGSGDLVGGQGGQAQAQQLVVAGEVLLLEAGQVAGPLLVPVTEVRAHGGVHAANAACR